MLPRTYTSNLNSSLHCRCTLFADALRRIGRTHVRSSVGIPEIDRRRANLLQVSEEVFLCYSVCLFFKVLHSAFIFISHSLERSTIAREKSGGLRMKSPLLTLATRAKAKTLPAAKSTARKMTRAATMARLTFISQYAAITFLARCVDFSLLTLQTKPPQKEPR